MRETPNPVRFSHDSAGISISNARSAQSLDQGRSASSKLSKRGLSSSLEEFSDRQSSQKRSASSERFFASSTLLAQPNITPTRLQSTRPVDMSDTSMGVAVRTDKEDWAESDDKDQPRLQPADRWTPAEEEAPSGLARGVSALRSTLAQLKLGIGIRGDHESEASSVTSVTTSTPQSDQGSRPESPGFTFASSPATELANFGVTGITPEQFISALDGKQTANHAETNPFGKDARVLAVDLRYVADFGKCHVRGSVNVNLPMLVLKRLRRGTVSSFQITNFLTGPDSKQLYEEWKTNGALGEDDNTPTQASVHGSTERKGPPTASDRVLIIYDDEMPEDNPNTEAWALISILAKGLAEDGLATGVRKGSPAVTPPTATQSLPKQTTIVYLRGGFRALHYIPSAAAVVEGTDSHLSPSIKGHPADESPALSEARRPGRGTQTSSPFHAPSPSTISIRTSNFRDDTISSPSVSTAPQFNGEPHTPSTSIPGLRPSAALLPRHQQLQHGGEPPQQRKKSAFSINTTKLQPQGRSRGVSSAASRGMNLQTISTPTAAVSNSFNSNSKAGAQHAGPGVDHGAPPMSAHPLNDNQDGGSRFPEVHFEPQTPLTARINTHMVQRSELSRRRSMSEPRRSLTSGRRTSSSAGSALSSTHSSDHNMSQLSPGPSTLPTPSEPVSVILPHLLLGSDAIPQAQDGIAQLKSLGVTHVLNMAVEVENKVIEASGEFEVKWCLAEDHAEHDIEGTIKEALDWIDEAHRADTENVIFVHCKAGRSRSATTAIAYLVVHERMRLRDAYEKVKQARPGVSPNLGFMLALLRIEKEVHGENTAAAAPTTDHSKAHNAEPRSHSHGELMA